MQLEYNQQDNRNVQKFFKISIEKLEQQFQCTVCLNPIEDCYVTRCGHVYCRKCIQQTINRHHRCPFCNQQLKQFKQDVFKNYHFNTIKKIVEEQKEKQSSKYLTKVFTSDALNRAEQQSKQINHLLKPIEQKIIKLSQQALLEYRKFTINLFDIEKKAQEKKALLGLDSIRDHEKIIKQLQLVITDCLKNPIIAPETIELLTNIQIELPGNKLAKKAIKLSPLITYEDLLPVILGICKDNSVQITGKISEELIINGKPQRMQQRLGMVAGKKIKIQKGIPFESKIFCFTHNWFKEKKSSFSICETCKIKWVCENCALYCHQGHDLKLQLKQQKPDWAICYCVTKYQCKAINKNSLEQ